MLRGKTSTGFDYIVYDSALDDWDLLEDLNAVDAGNYQRIIPAAHKMLGERQLEKLKRHCMKDGRVTFSAVCKEIAEIMNSEPKVKKS